MERINHNLKNNLETVVANVSWVFFFSFVVFRQTLYYTGLNG